MVTVANRDGKHLGCKTQCLIQMYRKQTFMSIRSTAKRLLKRAYLGLPSGMHVGTESYIYRPRRIDGLQCIRLGDRTTVDRYSWISAIERYGDRRYTPEIILGNDVHIGRYVCLTAINKIVIEDGCLLSEHVYASDLTHGMDPDAGLIVNQDLISKGEVRIGAHSFIGYRACIMPGVSLGAHCIVGANSVVTSSFGDYSMVAGCPARLIKHYSPERRRWLPVTECEENDQRPRVATLLR